MTEPEAAASDAVLDAVAHVEALAQTLYDEAMGRDWPMPYSSLTVSDQERWRGAAYCATYALALCPITRSVHPWLRSWCEPSCRTAASPQAEASGLIQSNPNASRLRATVATDEQATTSTAENAGD